MQVVECVNADALVVKTADGVQKKIHFSSLRPPRYCSCNELNSLAYFFGKCIFFPLKYSRIFQVKSKLISDATSNMPDIHVALMIEPYAAGVC